MRQLVLIALLLTLDACAGAPRPAPGTALRDCQDSADSDPAVRDAMLTAASAEPFSDSHKAYERTRAEAVRSCLRARGAIPRGGVQPVND